MGLKDVFKEKNFGNSSTVTQDEKLIVESRETVNEIIKTDNEFIPAIDFSDPKNFAKFGSAEEYYSSSIENVYKNYPYDGSKLAKQEFYNNLALHEKYIFDYEYPKSTGYVSLAANQYILINLSNKSSVLDREIPKGNIYDLKSNINNSFYLNSQDGNTVEFWYKHVSSNSGYLFDLSGSNNQRLSIYHSGSTLCVTYQSGSTGITGSLGGNSSSLGPSINWSVLKNSWHHYSITFLPVATGIKVTTIIDGNDSRSSSAFFQTHISGTAIGQFSSSGMKAAIGSTVTESHKTYGEFDEFKFWTKARNPKWIANTWFTNIHGGFDASNSKNDLGIYYKFNEGITGDASYDKIVLDYSGHFINGEIKNYTLGTKNTGSAFDLSGFFDFEEEGDHIIFSSNSKIQDFIKEKAEIGREHDTKNPSQFFYLFPEWVRNEDELYNEELKKLTQVLSSYLDKLYLQTQFLSEIKYNSYETVNQKALPFGKDLLESKGLEAPELFSDSSLLEEVFSRNEERPLEDSLNNIKNLIYKNIYNNLTYIYKSKGTEKSYRNLFRSFGIDDEILKFVIYTNNSEIDISRPKLDYTISKKSMIDFSYKNNHNANIYQVTSSGNPSAIVTSSFDRYKFLPTTLECQVIFPNIDIKRELFSWYVPSLSSSIFGIHSANSTGSDMTWGTNDKCNFQVYAIRDTYASKNVRFALKTNGYGLNTILTSSYFMDVYDNTKWNFGVRIKPNVDDMAYITSSNFSVPNYNLEFFGVQTNGDIVQNQFLLTQSITTLQAQSASLENKRIYAGAHRTNFTGSVLEQSDVKILNVRYWLNYLSNETLTIHSKDFNIYSPNNVSKKAFLGFITGSSATEQLNEIDTLILNWDFSSVTSSNVNGAFNINDIKISTRDNNVISDVSNKYFYGYGNNFKESDQTVADVDYIHISKNKIPEQLSTSDTIKILNQDDILYTPDTKPEQTFINIENSMYSIISEEMLKMFSSVNDFNNLIATPLNAYKKEYKELNYLKTLFFEKVNNIPNFERYLKLFKWIDDSIGEIIKQITPAGSEVPTKISTIIESHILERNKFERRLPLFQYSQKIGIFPIKTINELIYNWKSGHAPLASDPDTQIGPGGDTIQSFAVWLKDRAERTNAKVTSGNATVDAERQKLLNVIVNNNNQTSYNLRDINGNVYLASSYILRNAVKPYRLFAEIDPIADRKKKLRGIG